MIKIMQTAIDGFYSSSGIIDYVTRNFNGTHGYTTDALPSGSIEYYTVTYYDDYNYPNKKNLVTADTIAGNSGKYTANVRSLVTGTKTLVLDGVTPATYLVATIYYDDKYRPLQTERDLYDGSGGVETVSNQYDFIGQLLQSKTKQTFNSVTTEVLTTYRYDHARLNIRLALMLR